MGYLLHHPPDLQVDGNLNRARTINLHPRCSTFEVCQALLFLLLINTRLAFVECFRVSSSG